MEYPSPFCDDEEGFLTWLLRHADDGYVLNCYRIQGRVGATIRLHRACCRFWRLHLTVDRHFTDGKYCKVVDLSAQALRDFAEQRGDDAPGECDICMSPTLDVEPTPAVAARRSRDARPKSRLGRRRA